MDTAFARGNPSPKQSYKVQETLHFRYLKCLVNLPFEAWISDDLAIGSYHPGCDVTSKALSGLSHGQAWRIGFFKGGATWEQ